jgi:hypothetical protein
MTTLSLRRLWTIYKQTAVAQGFGSSKRDLALSHVAFYSAARGRARRNGVGAPDDQTLRQADQGPSGRPRGKLQREVNLIHLDLSRATLGCAIGSKSLS